MPARLYTALRRCLPRGLALPDADWRARHRVVVLVLALHLPLMLGYGLWRYPHPYAILVELLVVAGITALALPAGNRTRQSQAATFGLTCCAAMVVQLGRGAELTHLHFFVVLVLVALYQDWRPFAAAFAVFLAEQVTFAVIDYRAVYDDAASLRQALTLTLVHALYIVAAGAGLVVFWYFSERAHRREAGYRQQLLDAEMGALARMREAGQIREDLIASVSHEFRTPLTAIRGAATTLHRRGDQIRPQDRQMLLAGIAEHGERLSNLLEDMLAAASAAVVDPAAVADVTEAVQRLKTRPRLAVEVADRLAAYLDRDALGQLVNALADHGLDHGRVDRPVELAAAADGNQVVLILRYHSDSVQDDDPVRLLQPFGSRESAMTGRPTSLGLYVARRLAEVHGGRVTALVEDGRVSVEVRLRGLRTAGQPAEVRADTDAASAAPASEQSSARRVVRTSVT